MRLAPRAGSEAARRGVAGVERRPPRIRNYEEIFTVSSSRTLTIRRPMWARGTRLEDGRIYRNWFPNGFGAGLNRLHNPNGRRSALGFMCEQFGKAGAAELRNCGYPFELGIGLNLKTQGANPAIPASYPAMVEIARINDRSANYETITNEQQERLIAEKLIAAYGQELGFDRVEFVD